MDSVFIFFVFIISPNTSTTPINWFSIILGDIGKFVKFVVHILLNVLNCLLGINIGWIFNASPNQCQSYDFGQLPTVSWISYLHLIIFWLSHAFWVHGIVQSAINHQLTSPYWRSSLLKISYGFLNFSPYTGIF